MAEFETGYPSVRQIQEFIREKKSVEVKLTTGDVLTGTMIWQDTYCICLQDTSEQLITLWKNAIAYHKAVA